MEAKIDREFIVALKETNGSLNAVKVAIDKPVELISKLTAILENTSCSVYNMAELFTHQYPNRDEHMEYIAPNSYDDHGGKDSKKNFSVEYPTCLPYSELKATWEKAAKEGEQWCFEKCNKAGRTPDGTYINNCRRKFVATLIRNQKEKYMEKVLRWIDAQSYAKTCERLKAERDVRCFSKGGIGFHTYHHRILNDVNISLRTNFGYANASHSLLTLRYKGVDILPYSYLVNFYHADMVDLLRCTRVYELKRESWIEAFNFISEKVEEATENPERFIENYVITEVRTMINGLNELAIDSKAYMEKIADNKIERQKSVRCRCGAERQEMLVYADDMALFFKVEKITGAYDFVGNMSKLMDMCPRMATVLTNTINSIIAMYSALRPKIVDGIAKLRQRILSIEDTLYMEEQKLQAVTEQLSQYYARICQMHGLTADFSMHTFEVENPKFIELKKKSGELSQSIYTNQKTLKKLDSFLSYLSKSAIRIRSISLAT